VWRTQKQMAALELARRAVASPELTTDMGRGLVEIIARYTQTFLQWPDFDFESLPRKFFPASLWAL
jgi:hypothetical protein